jgi:hypothetical protein
MQLTCLHNNINKLYDSHWENKGGVVNIADIRIGKTTNGWNGREAIINPEYRQSPSGWDPTKK